MTTVGSGATGGDRRLTPQRGAQGLATDVSVQSAVFKRGTARIDGTPLGGVRLVPSEGNWAVGFNMNFDLLEYREPRRQR
jgi:hypothetical protein